jgi:phosphate transport system substrate-binding protein
MQALLEELNTLPGVLGSMHCDANGRPVAQALPPEQLDGRLREAATAAADSLRSLHAATGEATHLDLHYAERRILIVPVTDGSVVLVCEKGANPRQLLPSVAEVLRRAGALPGQRVAAAPPPRAAPDAGRARPSRVPPPAPGSRPAWRSPAVLGGAAALLVVLAAVGLWAATRGGSPGTPPPPAAAETDPVTILRIGGAKSFAAELVPAMAKAYLESLQLGDVRIAKLDAHRFAVRGEGEGAPWIITIEGLATPDGFSELAAGRLDIAMSGRRIRPEWQQKLDAFGSMMTPGREHVVALSGVAVIVNPSNLVPQLDRKQLSDVFSGAVTDWSELTGRKGGGPIVVYAGDDKMGLTDLFRTFVLGKTPYAPQAKRLATLQEMTDAVAQDPQGVGFVTLPFVRGTRAVPVSEGSEAPLVPTAFTLATEDYFLSHRLYFYAVPRPENAHLNKFVQFALGPEGQAVVKKSGYVELSVATAPREPPRDAPPEYARLTGGATRLSSTFRFEPASSDFDTRALVDLERVTAYLIENRLTGSAVRVLGFADSQGAPAVNRGLSVARAEQVAKALAQRGITGVAVDGFGSALPVASNQTAEGRERNRRVEVWIAR